MKNASLTYEKPDVQTDSTATTFCFPAWLGESSKEFWYGMHNFFTKGTESEND